MIFNILNIIIINNKIPTYVYIKYSCIHTDDVKYLKKIYVYSLICIDIQICLKVSEIDFYLMDEHWEFSNKIYLIENDKIVYEKIFWWASEFTLHRKEQQFAIKYFIYILFIQ